MVREPAPQTVLERVNPGWAKEQVITGLTVQSAAAGVPVRARVGEVGRVDQRGAGIGSHQDRSLETPRWFRFHATTPQSDPARMHHAAQMKSAP